jgi:hypothetical protein
MATSKQQLWTFRTSRRTYIFTTRQLIWKSAMATVCGLCVLAVAYSVYLVITVQRSNQELARIASTENRYMEKNWRELARSKQLLLYAGQSFAKRAGMPIGNADENGTGKGSDRSIRRLLLEPYASNEQVDRMLGKPDKQNQDANCDHRIWQCTRWEKPAGWPANGTIEKPWPYHEERVLEAWFDAEGRLLRMIITRQEPGGYQATEHIGRQAEDWKSYRSEAPPVQPANR